jgi:hypothetical protein
MQQNIQRLQREGVLPEPGPRAPAAAGTQPPAARRLSRYALFFRAADTPLYGLACTVVGMVIGVWWGLRWPRRLTVLAVAAGAPNAVIQVPWVARAAAQAEDRRRVGPGRSRIGSPAAGRIG